MATICSDGGNTAAAYHLAETLQQNDAIEHPPPHLQPCKKDSTLLQDVYIGTDGGILLNTIISNQSYSLPHDLDFFFFPS